MTDRTRQINVLVAIAQLITPNLDLLLIEAWANDARKQLLNLAVDNAEAEADDLA